MGYSRLGFEDEFAIKQDYDSSPTPGPRFHLAFSAESHDAVNAFFTAAVQNGGSAAGQPGFRPHYGPDYYAAYIMGPDGYRTEAVIVSKLIR
jgi:hypothetical protein